MRLIIILSIFLSYAFAKAQTYEVGIWAGGSNVIGDVGSTTFIDPKDLTFGGIIKWNRSDRHSFRATVIMSNFVGDDNDSDDRSRDLRGYKYDYKMLEASLGIEYNFWEWNMYESKPQLVPYMYTGLTGFFYEAHSLNSSFTDLESYERDYSFAIPFILGVKYNVVPHVVLAAEVGVRYTFTDNLDGSNPEGEREDMGLAFGNINNSDFYVFSGFTLTYTFGRKPCYCNF